MTQEVTKLRQEPLTIKSPAAKSQKEMLKLHEKVIGGDNSHDSSSFEEVLIEKMPSKQAKVQNFPLALGSKDSNPGDGLKKTLPLPKLDLTKAKKLQELQIKRQNAVEAQEISENEKKHLENIEK